MTSSNELASNVISQFERKLGKVLPNNARRALRGSILREFNLRKKEADGRRETVRTQRPAGDAGRDE